MNSGRLFSSLRLDEIVEAIQSLSPANWARLRLVAKRYARPQISADDLLQEAFARALDGRKCPVDVDVVKFLAEAMRSIANGESEKVEHRLVVISAVAKDGELIPAVADYPDKTGNIEVRTIQEEDAARIRRQICAHFDDDPVAQLILDGMIDEMDGEELRELTELDKTAYDSKRKLIRRRMNKHYPEGWKP